MAEARPCIFLSHDLTTGLPECIIARDFQRCGLSCPEYRPEDK